MHASTLEERNLYSGFQTSKNAYMKKELRMRQSPAGKGLPSFPSMALERSNANSSELQQNTEKKELRSNAHVPKLLLT